MKAKSVERIEGKLKNGIPIGHVIFHLKKGNTYESDWKNGYVNFRSQIKITI